MRQLLIDELSPADVIKLTDWLRSNTIGSAIEGLFWVELPHELLDPDQKERIPDHPFCFAVEVGETWVKFELLIRSHINMRSPLTRYAGAGQQMYIMNFSNHLIEELDLKT